MSGTGFFDNFETIDTSSEKGALNKAPVTKTVPTGFQEPPANISNEQVMEAMPPEFHQEVEKMKQEFVHEVTQPSAPPQQESGQWMTVSLSLIHI